MIPLYQIPNILKFLKYQTLKNFKDTKTRQKDTAILQEIAIRYDSEIEIEKNFFFFVLSFSSKVQYKQVPNLEYSQLMNFFKLSVCLSPFNNTKK